MPRFRRLNLLTLLLCFVLIVLGAFVRLSNAGLGCPDWPGCYGHVIGVPDAAHEVASAEQNFPDRPVEAPKAWKEMAHRYLAGIVGLLIGTLALLAWRDRSQQLPRALTAATVAVVLVQIVFGALTVTLKVNPLIVTTHLLLGMTTLSLLWWMWLSTAKETQQPTNRQRAPRNERQAWQRMSPVPERGTTVKAATPLLLRSLALLALILLVTQLFLGGWTSTNYAALACPDFPTCHGSFLPQTEIADAFKLWHGHDIDYEYGILDVAARATVHMVHRYGALVLSLVLSGVALYLLLSGISSLRRLGVAVLAALALQVGIGIGLVHLQLPLWLADAHNAGAALLLLAVLALNHHAWTTSRVGTV